MIFMKSRPDAQEAVVLLMQVAELLMENGERNWIRGVRAALSELVNEDGSVNEAGFENARSIYNTMTAGGRGFSEYFVSEGVVESRLGANKRLDAIRSKLWKIFNP